MLVTAGTRRSRKTPTVHSETRLLLADLLDKAASSGMVCFRSEFEECTTVAIHTVWVQCGCSGFCAPFCMFALHFCTASFITSTATLVHVVLRRRDGQRRTASSGMGRKGDGGGCGVFQ